MKEFNFNYKSKTAPFEHQIEAIHYVEQSDQVAIFDEQGLGKTKIVIEGLINNIKHSVIDGAIIICKKSLIQNWREEIEFHSYLKSIILRGSKITKGRNYMGFAHFYIINYESVNTEFERLKLFLGIRKFAIVLDESHTIKNPESIAAKAIIDLGATAIKKIIISGTPVANNPVDLWSQFYFLDHGELLGTDFKAFKKKFTYDVKDPNSIPVARFNELKELLSQNSIRRTKDAVLELPEKVYKNIFVELKKDQLEIYEILRDELIVELKSYEGDILLDEANSILKKLIRLTQVASNPFLLNKDYREVPAKLEALDNLVDEIIANNEKLIVWSSFVENIKTFTKRYIEHNAVMIHGELDIKRRNRAIDLFKNDPDVKILIANPSAAREGLTLTVANHAIYFDRSFNLVDYLQSQDRIHRISQNKKCYIVKLIAQGTIDVFIDEILSRKSKIANFLQGDHSELELNNKITKEELLQYIT